MKIPYYVVHSFTDRIFGGNPAGVCPVEEWPPDEVLQKIAFENNLAETAFFSHEASGLRLRWFAPKAEVDLCGHATLAAAFVLYECLGHAEPSVSFETRSGRLSVVRDCGRLSMDFPLLTMNPVPISPELTAALGATPILAFESMDLVAVFEDESQVESIRPDLDSLRQIPGRGVIVTAPGHSSDYVLRCFGPKVGIPEDPATGSAQSMLAPYWSARLEKNVLSVRQLSSRGGEMVCTVNGSRVEIAGNAALYLNGHISI
jgi:PhzF family phenazine biosynthesis protein